MHTTDGSENCNWDADWTATASCCFYEKQIISHAYTHNINTWWVAIMESEILFICFWTSSLTSSIVTMDFVSLPSSDGSASIWTSVGIGTSRNLATSVAHTPPKEPSITSSNTQHMSSKPRTSNFLGYFQCYIPCLNAFQGRELVHIQNTENIKIKNGSQKSHTYLLQFLASEVRDLLSFERLELVTPRALWIALRNLEICVACRLG